MGYKNIFISRRLLLFQGGLEWICQPELLHKIIIMWKLWFCFLYSVLSCKVTIIWTLATLTCTHTTAHNTSPCLLLKSVKFQSRIFPGEEYQVTVSGVSDVLVADVETSSRTCYNCLCAWQSCDTWCVTVVTLMTHHTLLEKHCHATNLHNICILMMSLKLYTDNLSLNLETTTFISKFKSLLHLTFVLFSKVLKREKVYEVFWVFN